MTIFASICLFFVLFFPDSALAYLDPGSGSMLLQVILGGAAAVGVVLKMYWYRIKKFFSFGDKSKVDE